MRSATTTKHGTDGRINLIGKGAAMISALIRDPVNGVHAQPIAGEYDRAIRVLCPSVEVFRALQLTVAIIQNREAIK